MTWELFVGIAGLTATLCAIVAFAINQAKNIRKKGEEWGEWTADIKQIKKSNETAITQLDTLRKNLAGYDADLKEIKDGQRSMIMSVSALSNKVAVMERNLETAFKKYDKMDERVRALERAQLAKLKKSQE